MNNDTIKANIARMREAAGISQEEMARRLGIVRNTYRSIEKGDTKLVSDWLDEIARIFGTSTDKLVGGYGAYNEDGSLDEIQEKYSKDISNLRKDLETRIQELQSKLEEKDLVIKELRESLADKNEIIKFLKERAAQSNIADIK